MQTYRIYTEDMNRDGIREIVSDQFDSYTLIPCQGVWKGAAEDALIIEIIETSDRVGDIGDVAARIRQVNKQEAVLFTRTEVTALAVTE